MLPIALAGYVVLFAVVVAVFYAAGRAQAPNVPEEPPLEFEEEIDSKPRDHELV